MLYVHRKEQPLIRSNRTKTSGVQDQYLEAFPYFQYFRILTNASNFCKTLINFSCQTSLETELVNAIRDL